MKYFLIVTPLIFLFFSCKEKGEVIHYRVAKQTQKPTLPSSQIPTSSYKWDLPAGWTAKPASNMRLATIVIPFSPTPLEASISEFGGDISGNINRWRKQIGLPTLPKDKILPSLKKITTRLGEGYIVHLTNPNTPEKAMLTAIIPRPSGNSVFVKITAPSAALKSVLSDFKKFTASIRP